MKWRVISLSQEELGLPDAIDCPPGVPSMTGALPDEITTCAILGVGQVISASLYSGISVADREAAARGRHPGCHSGVRKRPFLGTVQGKAPSRRDRDMAGCHPTKVG
jgi:hypothetical protein